MARANIPEDERKDFTMYVDEFQNFATDSFETILSEARKYRLSLVLGNQFMTQLKEELREAKEELIETKETVNNLTEQIEAQNNIVVSESRLTALIGVRGLVVVHSDNATLICPRERAEELMAHWEHAVRQTTLAP